MLNRILSRQVLEHFVNPDELPESVRALLHTVSLSYEQYEQDRRVLESSVRFSSDKMIALNEELRKENSGARASHQQLEAANLNLNTLFNSVKEVLYSVDMVSYRLIQISAACEKVYGHSREEFLTQPDLWQEVIHPEDRHIAHDQVEKLYQGIRIFNQYRIIHKDGSIHWLENEIIPTLNSDGVLIRLDGISNDVTEKIAQEKKLLESEMRFRSLIENSSDMLMMFTAENKVMYESPSVQKTLGYAAAEQMECSILQFIHPEDQEKAQNAYEKALSEPDSCVQLAVRVQTKNGYIYTEGSISNMLHLEGVRALVLNLRDVTLRIEAERGLRESKERYKLVYENPFLGIALGSIDGMIENVNATFCRMLGYDQEEIYQQHFSAFTTPEDFEKEMPFILEMKEGRLNNYQLEKRFITKSDGIIWATLNVSCARNEAGEIRFVVAMIQDITSRKTMEQALQKSQANLTAIIENTDAHVYSLDREFRYITFNSQLKQTMKQFYDLDIKPGVKVFGFLEKLDPIEAVEWHERYKKALTGESLSFVKEYIHDGQRGFIDFSINPIRENNTITGLSCFARDISTQIIGEENVRRSEANLRAIFENSHSSYLLLDSDLNLISFNPKAVEWAQNALRIELNEGDNWLSYFTEEHHADLIDKARRITNGETIRYEKTYTHPDETLHYYEVVLSPVHYTSGRVLGVCISLNDITERRFSDESLQKSEANLRSIIENTDTIYILLNPEINVISFNPAAEKWAKDELKAELCIGTMLIDIFPGARRQELDSKAEAVLRGEKITYEIGYPQEDHSFHYYTVVLNPILDQSGTVLGICISLNDITERKYSEKSLQKSEANLRSIIENADSIYILLDPRTKVLSFNPAAQRWAGHEYNITLEEGMTLIEHFPAAMQEELHNRAKTILSGEKIFYETGYPQADDSIRYYAVTLAPITDISGTILGICISMDDITRLKNTERLIRKSNERYELASKATNDAIWDWNLTTNQLYWSEGYEKLFGYKIAEDQPVSINSWNTRIHPEDAQRVFNNIHKTIYESGGAYWEDQYRYIKSNGEIAYVYDRGYIIYDKRQKPVRMVGAMHDITSEKLSALERERISADLIRQNKDLEQFAYIVSHNLRAPLANISGLTRIIENEELDSKVYRISLDGLVLSVKKMENVIADLSHILQVKREINEKKEIVKFSEMVEDIKTSISHFLEKEAAVIVTDFSQSEEIFTLKSYMHSIFYNLIINSIKYHKPGEKSMIRISSRKEGTKTILVFEDNGQGIDLALHSEKVFGLYKRFNLNVEGKGMGLFMVKTQTETLGGKISIQSEVNKGTSFTLEFEN